MQFWTYFCRAFQTAVPLNLWNSLETAIEPNFLPVPLTEIMENWITKPGFPIVKVSLQGNNVNLAQVNKFSRRKSVTKSDF